MRSISSTGYFFVKVLPLLLLVTTPLFAVSGRLNEDFCQSNLSDLHRRFMPYPVVYRESLQSIFSQREKLKEPLLPPAQVNQKAAFNQDYGVFPKPLEGTVETRFNHNNNNAISIIPNLSLERQGISNAPEINRPSFYRDSSSNQPCPVETQREENNPHYYQSHHYNFSVQSPFKSKEKTYKDDTTTAAVQKLIEVKDQEVMDQATTIFRKGYNRTTVDELQFIMRHFPFHEAVANFNQEGLEHAYMPCHAGDFKQYYNSLGITKWGYKKKKPLLNF